MGLVHKHMVFLTLMAFKMLPLTQLKPKILPNGPLKGFETDITGTTSDINQFDLKD